MKDQAVGRLFRLVEQCDAATLVRLADQLEETLEIGPYGVYQLPCSKEPVVAGTPSLCDECDHPADPVCISPQSRHLLAPLRSPTPM